MRQRFLSFVLNFIPLLIGCAIFNLQCLPVIRAFSIARHTSCGTRTTRIPTDFSTGSATNFPPFVGSGTKRMGTRLFDKQQDNDDEETKAEDQVEVRTKDYYSGFLSSPIQDETVAERGSGLEQALKLGGGVVVVLVVLVAGFLVSNGLI